MKTKIDNILAKKYEDLTLIDIAKLRCEGYLNGFGGASQSRISRYLISLIMDDFDMAIL